MISRYENTQEGNACNDLAGTTLRGEMGQALSNTGKALRRPNPWHTPMADRWTGVLARKSFHIIYVAVIRDTGFRMMLRWCLSASTIANQTDETNW